MGRHAMTIQIFFQRVCYAENKTVHIDWLSFQAALPKQGSNAVEHIIGTMPVAFYAGQGLTCFVMIRWRRFKPQQCCISVCHDGAQGLAYFMSNHSRDRLRVQ